MKKLRAREGGLTKEEMGVIKALLTKGWRNQDIQALVNLGRKATINSARVTGVKKDMSIAPSDDDYVSFFIERKRAFDPRTGLNHFSDERLIRAREAMILAVNIFNNPTMKFKTEAFSILSNVAWTHLLHEFYVKKNISIVGKDGRTLLLSQMIKRQDCPLTAGVKNNIDSMKQIRDDAEHGLLGRSDDKWLSLFQACCLNFDRVIQELFGEQLSLQGDLSLALQFSKLNIDQVVTTNKYMIPATIEALDARIKGDLTEEQLSDIEYQFRVIYTLDSASKSQSHMQFIHPSSDDAKSIRNVLVKYAFQDDMYPFKPKQVITLVSNQSGKSFTLHNHAQAWQKFSIRPRAGVRHPENTNKDYCIYNQAHTDYTYSKKWVEFIVSQIITEDGYKSICSFKI